MTKELYTKPDTKAEVSHKDMSLKEAAEMALETLCVGANDAVPNDIDERFEQAIQALRQALTQPEQEQKTPLKVLNLTVFTGNRLRNGRVYDVETLQTMTNRDILAIPDMGKKALKEVLEALGAYASDMSQECVDETVKGEHKREWVGLDGEIPGLGLVTEEFYNGMIVAEDILREKNHG